jgi:hypothetical protein
VSSSGSESDGAGSSRRKERRSRRSRKRELGRGESERVARELEEAAAGAARLAGTPAPPRRASPPRRGRQPIPDMDLERGSAVSSASTASYITVSDASDDKPRRWWQQERVRI